MATDKYLYNNGGVITEKTPVVTSTPDAIPALDGTGKLNANMLPVGAALETDDITATEALSAGDLVNIYDSTGAKCRKADGSTTGKEAHGFVLAAVDQDATATVYRASQSNNQKTGMTPGKKQYLSTTVPGGTQETAPTGAGKTLQVVGRAVSASTMIFQPQDPIVLAA
jgi:hypothetical protein